MSLTSEFNSANQAVFDKVLHEQCYDSHPFLAELNKRKKIGDFGLGLKWDIEYTKLGTANAVDPNAKFQYNRIPIVTQVTDTPKFYVNTVMVTWKEIQANKGPGRVIDIQKAKSQALLNDFMQRFATDLYTANPNGNGITPITTIVDSTTTYAGLAVADCSIWASTEDSSTTQVVINGTSTSLKKYIDTCTFGGKGPDFFLTTKDIRNTIENKIEARKRYEAGDAGSKPNIGTNDVILYGHPVMGDPDCPTSMFLGLCMDDLELWVDPDWDREISPWTDMAPEGYKNSIRKELCTVMNLKGLARRRHFKYTALDYTE